MYINVLLSFLTILFLVSSQKIEGVESESKTDLLRGFWQSMKFKDNQINVKEFISLFWDEEGVEIGENASKFLAKSFKQLSDDNWVTEDEFVDFYGGPYEGFFPVLPYEPVEVHVNIVRDDEEKLGGNDVEDQMRVFFVTKEALDDSFIEYHTSSSQDPVRVSCDMYTYEVPKNWWNVFTGQIYAAIISLDSIPTSSSLFYKVFDLFSKKLQLSIKWDRLVEQPLILEGNMCLLFIRSKPRLPQTPTLDRLFMEIR